MWICASLAGGGGSARPIISLGTNRPSPAPGPLLPHRLPSVFFVGRRGRPTPPPYRSAGPRGPTLLVLHEPDALEEYEGWKGWLDGATAIKATVETSGGGVGVKKPEGATVRGVTGDRNKTMTMFPLIEFLMPTVALKSLFPNLKFDPVSVKILSPYAAENAILRSCRRCLLVFVVDSSRFPMRATSIICQWTFGSDFPLMGLPPPPGPARLRGAERGAILPEAPRPSLCPRSPLTPLRYPTSHRPSDRFVALGVPPVFFSVCRGPQVFQSYFFSHSIKFLETPNRLKRDKRFSGLLPLF